MGTETVPAPALDEIERRARLVDLYRRERVAMVRLAHVLTSSATVAEDVVQDAFVRLYPVLDTADNPGAYLRRTVVNLCHSQHRRSGVERRWLARQPPADVVLTPEMDETWRALARLSPAQRQVLVLRFYLDLRVEDIADLLGLRAGTVKSTLHRGLAALSKEITP